MLAILATLVVFFAVFGNSQAALSDDYQNNQRLDSQNATDYMLYWTHNKADSTISFAAKAKTTGWVGLGFMTKMDNTTTYDVVRGSYDDFVPNKTEIYDFHAVGKETPVKDTVQNLMNTSVAESNSYTTIKFKRKLDTQDSNDTVIKPGPMTVVWSVGNIDHLNSGYREIGYKTVTFIPEDQKNDSTAAIPSTTTAPTMTTIPSTTCSANKAALCQENWLLLTVSALLFLVPVLSP